NIPQTGFLWPHQKELPPLKNVSEKELPSHDECMADKATFASAFRVIEEISSSIEAPRLLQKVNDQIVVINPPFPIPEEKGADEPYELA
ncbi:MAG: YgiQ family radical SAM protein, partial [Bacteroidales bacterium]